MRIRGLSECEWTTAKWCKMYNKTMWTWTLCIEQLATHLLAANTYGIQHSVHIWGLKISKITINWLQTCGRAWWGMGLMMADLQTWLHDTMHPHKGTVEIYTEDKRLDQVGDLRNQDYPGLTRETWATSAFSHGCFPSIHLLQVAWDHSFDSEPCSYCSATDIISMLWPQNWLQWTNPKECSSTLFSFTFGRLPLRPQHVK